MEPPARKGECLGVVEMKVGGLPSLRKIRTKCGFGGISVGVQRGNERGKGERGRESDRRGRE